MGPADKVRFPSEGFLGVTRVDETWGEPREGLVVDEAMDPAGVSLGNAHQLDSGSCISSP